MDRPSPQRTHTSTGIKGYRAWIVAVTLIAALVQAGCGDSPPVSKFEGEAYAKAVTVTGEVRLGSRMLIQGHLSAADFNGQPLGASDWSNAPFALTLPAGTLFPIVLTAQLQGADSGHAPLKLVVVKPGEEKLLISERSTAIAEKAAQLGGFSPDNIMAATLESSGPVNAGGGPHGESTQHYGGWH